MVRLREVLRATSFLLVLVFMSAASPLRASENADKSRPGVQPIVLAADVMDTSWSIASGASLTDLPPNLRVPRDLRPMLEQAMRRSPTFQRQLQMLRRTQRVRMSVTYGGVRGMRMFQAHSTVTHHQYGALLVETELFAPADMVELVAHEIEHVCEQIEGVDLKALSLRHDSGVYDLGGHYETQRAIAAGHRVSRELRGLSADEQPVHTTY